MRRAAPFAGIVLFVLAWDVAVRWTGAPLVPTPWQALRGIGELAWRGLLLKYVVASLFRVTWGYLLAVVIAIPFGIAVGMSPRMQATINPLLQVLRPISPLAWIPIAILWFGVGDLSAVFLIFLASFFPLAVTAMVAVQDVDPVHVRAGTNFGMSRRQLVLHVVLPAVVPQLIVGMRIALGIAWLVVVAAEMIAVNSGLGFLIVDARNAGNRYDLVVAGMLLIGAIGIALDLVMRRMERLDFVRWGYAEG
ncbi:MAG TPA: ABC transporter permease [Thermoanaerobaculia bacterium]|nr:ABC transporter permease [Thermoanaerobaculia bacterium]